MPTRGQPHRFAIRATADDEAIAADLQRSLRDLPGRAFITRSDTVRVAMRIACAAFAEGVAVPLMNRSATPIPTPR